MNEIQRHQQILSLLERDSMISISFLVENLNISPATARRDIAKLDETGKLKKVRNGAERVENKQLWTPLTIQSTIHFDEKSRIAKAAASLCKENDSVVINCGSTAFLLGQELKGKKLQIITNYFPLANYLINEGHDQLVIIGGQYHHEQHIFLNPNLDTQNTYAGHWLFTSGKGLTASGLYKTNMLTAVNEQQMLSQIDQLVVVVDSSKVGRKSGMLFCPAQKIDIVITGKDADPEIIQALREQDVEIILV